MRANEEYELSKAISKYLKHAYPKVIFRFDMAGLNLSKAQAGQNKAIQHSRAYPDLFILEDRVCEDMHSHGLFIELKKEGTRIYKQNGDFASPHLQEQWNMLQQLIKVGYLAKFAVGFNEAKFIIDSYLRGF